MTATVYEYNNEELFKDEGGAYTIEEIQAHYSQHFGELAQATYTVIPAQGDTPRKVIFAKKVGTKGSAPVVEALLTLEPAQIAAVELLQAIAADSGTENLLRLAADIEAAIPEAERISRESEKVVTRCLQLRAIPTRTTPDGF